MRSAHVGDVELMAPGKQLAFHGIERPLRLVGDVEAFLEGEHLFLQYQFHAFLSLRVAFSCAIIPQKRPRRNRRRAFIDNAFYPCYICTGDFPRQEGAMAPGFCPLLYRQPSCTKEVVVMTDYEMLALVIMIFMLVLAVMGYYKHDK